MSVEPTRVDREAAFMRRVVRPRLTNLTPEAAQAILDLRIDDRDRRRMKTLLESSTQATLSTEDQAELDSYLTMGHFLDLMRAKALGSLKKAGIDAHAHVDE